MGMYTSFKVIAVIEEPYRQWFHNMIEEYKYAEEEYEQDDISTYINHIYTNSGGFFNVERDFSKETGILICGGRAKDYGHFHCDESEIEHCIKNAILPFGELVKYYRHEDDYCTDCICNPEEISGDPWFINRYKRHYMDKYKDIIAKFTQTQLHTQDNHSTTNPLKEKMKVFLIKDIENVLGRYNEYNFDVTDLKTSLEKL